MQKRYDFSRQMTFQTFMIITSENHIGIKFGFKRSWHKKHLKDQWSY